MSNIDRDLFLQKETRNKIIKEFGTGLWVPVYYNHKEKMREITFWSYFISNKFVSKYLKKVEWDLLIGSGNPGCSFTGGDHLTVEYHRFGCYEGVEPLVFIREFIGDKESYVEVSEEFRLYHGLYHDKDTNTYYKIDENGNEDPVIKIEDMNVKIKLKYLKQFLAIKDMHLALCFEIDQYSDKKLEDMGLEDGTTCFQFDNVIYDLHLIDRVLIADPNVPSLSRIIGKKLIPGMDKEDSDVWSFKDEDYEDFIIGVDENGENILYTCNPEKLANFFGANPNAPQYLTFIFFSRDVLLKYYAKPTMYSVEDGRVSLKGSWSLRVDNHNPDYIIVYLGDLGKDIPYQEQHHWKNFNIVPDGQLSKVKFKRDLEGKWADAEISDLKFKARYKRSNELWHKKYGWKLFLDLSKEDQHHFDSLRIPLTNEQSEFDSQVSSLVKIVIDSLNEKELLNNVSSDTEGISGSIFKLELFLNDYDVNDYTRHIKFLRNLQDLRSTGVAHRKGKKYQKVSKFFGIGNNNLSEVFDNILGNMISFLEFMNNLTIE